MGSSHRFVTELDFTKTQLAVFFVILLLAMDEINPVKIFLQVFPSIQPWHVGMTMIALMMYVFVSEMKALFYFAAEMFFQAIISIFFREVDVVGRENIPKYGPVLFTINHANQFMDAIVVVCTCQRKISYLMAEASWKRRVIGDLAWALDVVPVKRQQDDAHTGAGTITIPKPKTTTVAAAEAEEAENQNTEETKSVHVQVDGTGTIFTKQVGVGDKLRPPGTAIGLKVVAIESDECLKVDVTDMDADSYPWPDGGTYDILRRTDTKVVFGKVLDRLAAGGAVGIFPEGGSHDRTDLLPLKVGVALIAYSALDKDGLNVPIVPVGLSYFQAHRWRGRAVVEFGRPIQVDPDTLPEYKSGGSQKRKVCNKLLEEIETSMRSVIVSAPNYDTLELIHTARRLYRRNKGGSNTSVLERQELSRRFAEGFKRLMSMMDGDPPKEWLDLRDRLVEYQKELKYLGLKDYQVMEIRGEHLEQGETVDPDTVLNWLKLPYQIGHLLFLLVVAAIPTLFLHLPVGFLAGVYAERRRKKALARSKVKIKAYDVMLTEKVVFCIVMVPTLWLTYSLALMLLTDVDLPTIAVGTLCMPLFSYMGIIVTDAGMLDVKELRPFFMRLFPSTRRRLGRIPETRKHLQADLRAFIKSVGPSLGEIYYDKEVDWKEVQEKSRQMDEEKKIK